jgi:hypothetical protein
LAVAVADPRLAVDIDKIMAETFEEEDPRKGGVVCEISVAAAQSFVLEPALVVGGYRLPGCRLRNDGGKGKRGKYISRPRRRPLAGDQPELDRVIGKS